MTLSKLLHRCICRKIILNILVILILAIGVPTFIGADVKLPSVIGDNMVLQRGMNVPIWGMAEPSEEVTVTFGDQKLTTMAGNDGKWMVRLNPLEAGGPFEMTVAGNNTIKLQNVLVGEVWVCSGQSNMQWDVRNSANPEEEIKNSDYPMIRLFTAERVVADEPLWNTAGNWVTCRPETVGTFSAVGYFFGRDIHKVLDVPVGLIHTSWGGTPAESWTSLPTLKAGQDFKPILDRWDEVMAKYPEAQKEHEEKLAQWEKDAQKAKDEGNPAPNKPSSPVSPNHPWKPSGLYNGMIAPLIPYAIKGAIWYQGESNANRAYQYRNLFATMIRDWWLSWGQGDFPFLFVQLANFMERKPEPSESMWAELREAQLMTLALPNTGMAVAIDIGEEKDIHPKNKQDVGHRLALSALGVAYKDDAIFKIPLREYSGRTVYGRDVIHSGPIYESMSVDGKKVRLHFKYAESGLMTSDKESPKGFAIAGEDKKFVWADAVIDGDMIVVWNDNVSQPVAVRYAWADNPLCNVYNKAGLPASPFRTDDWKGFTADER